MYGASMKKYHTSNRKGAVYMSVNIMMNNLAAISGKITPNFRPCPGNAGKALCMTDLAVERLSGYMDYIPLSISWRTADIMNYHIGEYIWTAGRFVSYNYHDLEGSHLNLSLLMKIFSFLDHTAKNENNIFLDGYLSRKPVMRTTPLGCKITDLLVAINYPYLQSDYIPCICWNNYALEASQFSRGTHVHIWGRIQSRNYKKSSNEGSICIRTAYEVCIWKIILPENKRF